MKNHVQGMIRVAAALALLVLAGCAHPVTLRTDIKYPQNDKLPQTVGYYISDAHRALEVTTKGGGGDMIKYSPYHDLEPALIETLSSVFSKVYSVPEQGRQAYIASHDITFVFEPIIQTQSDSHSAFFWPPSDFEITLHVTAVDAQGKSIWSGDFTGHGHVEKNRSLTDVPPANLAAQEAFGKLRKALLEAPAFKAAQETQAAQ